MQIEATIGGRAYDRIVQEVQEGIARGELVRGQKLPTEREMRRDFGVSRGAVRDAMRVLGTMGLVEARQGSGNYVRNNPVSVVSRALTLSVASDEDAVRHLFEFREPLETLAARLAAALRSTAQLEAIRREADATAEASAHNNFDAFVVADWALHGAIGQASGNPYLSTVLNVVREMQRDVLSLMVRQPGSMATAVEQHRRIVAAITVGAADEAAAAMREHVLYSANAPYHGAGEGREARGEGAGE